MKYSHVDALMTHLEILEKEIQASHIMWNLL